MNRENYLRLCSEAGLLVVDIDRKLIELQELEECIAAADRQAAGGSGTQVKAGIAPVDPVGAIQQAEFLFEFDADGFRPRGGLLNQGQLGPGKRGPLAED
jgi:hypothetical protein